MATQLYPNTVASVQSILQSVSVGEKNQILQLLQNKGLLANTGVAIESLTSPGRGDPPIDVSQTQAVIYGQDVALRLNSTGPVVAVLSGGTNYLDTSHFQASRDRADTVIGGSGHDTIVGNTAAELLIAGTGYEDIRSGGGADTLRGGAGYDTLTGGGHSLIQGGNFAGSSVQIVAGVGPNAQDTVKAGRGFDDITLTQGNNTVLAPTGGGMATIKAGSGQDTIYGAVANQGTEAIYGGGKTVIDLNTGTVKFNLGKGNDDTIFGGQGTGQVFINKASTDFIATATKVGGQSATTLTFASGGSVTTVGTVNFVFTDTKKTP